MDKQIAQDVTELATRLGFETSYDHRTQYTCVNLTLPYPDEYFTVDELDEVDLTDYNLEAGEGDQLKPGVYWVGSWTIGPLYGIPMEDVVAWAESTKN